MEDNNETIVETRSEMADAIFAARRELRRMAVAVFERNPHWRSLHDAAPEGARAWLEELFAASFLGHVETTAEEWRKLSGATSADDWKWLAETSGNQMARAQYRKAAACVAAGGSVSACGHEFLNPFVNLK